MQSPISQLITLLFFFRTIVRISFLVDNGLLFFIPFYFILQLSDCRQQYLFFVYTFIYTQLRVRSLTQKPHQ